MDQNLNYFGARYYDHWMFRFTSVDPVINKDEALTNPQLWNLYAYCRNNPITYFDPDGRVAETNFQMSITPTQRAGMMSVQLPVAGLISIGIAGYTAPRITTYLYSKSGDKIASALFKFKNLFRSNKPSYGQIRQFEKQFFEHGKESLIKSRTSLLKKLSEHIGKFKSIKEEGGHLNPVLKEIRNFRRQIRAIDKVLKK